MEIIDASRLNFAAKTKQECRSELLEARWNGCFKCPKCENEKAYWISTRQLYECANRNCRKQTSATAGTQLHKTRDLKSAFVVLLEIAGNAPVSSGTVRAETGISYSSGRKLIERLCAPLRLSITLLPAADYLDQHQTQTTRKHELLNESDSAETQQIPSSNQCNLFGAPTFIAGAFSSIRLSSIEHHFKLIAKLLYPEITLRPFTQFSIERCFAQTAHLAPLVRPVS